MKPSRERTCAARRPPLSASPTIWGASQRPAGARGREGGQAGVRGAQKRRRVLQGGPRLQLAPGCKLGAHPVKRPSAHAPTWPVKEKCRPPCRQACRAGGGRARRCRRRPFCQPGRALVRKKHNSKRNRPTLVLHQQDNQSSSTPTLEHEAQRLAGHAAGVHADAGRGEARHRSLHKVGTPRHVPAAAHDGAPAVLDEGAHAEVGAHLPGPRGGAGAGFVVGVSGRGFGRGATGTATHAAPLTHPLLPAALQPQRLERCVRPAGLHALLSQAAAAGLERPRRETVPCCAAPVLRRSPRAAPGHR